MAARKTERKANGTGTIRKRADGRWEGRYTVGFDPKTGKQRQKSVYGSTQKEVRQKLSAVASEIDAGTYVEPRKETVAEWLDVWLETYVAVSVKPYTYDSYMRHCKNHIKPALGRIKLTELSSIQIQQFYNSLLMEKKLSPKTVKNINGVLHSALEQARELRMIALNPTELCTLPRAPRKKIQPMEREEVAEFLKRIEGNRYELIYRVTLFTGMREGEVLGLTWDCIDYEKNTIAITQQLQKTKKVGGKYALVPTKNSRNRTITVAPSVMTLLRERKRQQLQDQLMAGEAWDNPWNLVFTREDGKNLCHFTVYRFFKDVVREMGLGNQRFHDLRHEFAVASLESGDDIKTVQENLGHATASFTLDVYGHVSQQMRKESAARMEGFIQAVS